MRKTIVIILVVIVLILALGIAGVFGFLWYRDNHVFVEGDAYPVDIDRIDLREEDISFDYYNSLREQLPGADILWNVPFQGSRYSCDVQQLIIDSLTEEDISVLEGYFPDLQSVDASACHDYAILEMLMERLPGLEVRYAVSLGGQTYDPRITDIVLSEGDYDFVTMMDNLAYLHELTAVKLRMPQLSTEQLEELKAAYEHITFTCTVEILGQEYETDTTELDLSALNSSDLAVVTEQLLKLPGLQKLELMAPDGTSNLTKADVKLLMEAVPDAVINYSFEYKGYTISTADEEVHITNKKIGEEGLPEVREILDIMTNCRRFVLENCQIPNESMAKLRDDYREKTKVVWRVSYGKGSTLTDAEVIRAVYDLVDDNCHNLVYCEDAKYMDIGHNEWLDACDFVSGMKSLEYVIISGAPIKSLEPFRHCKNLKLLEAAFCEYITDVSPLAECGNLQMLNISNTHVTDLSPLDDLPLTHLCVRTNPSGRCRLSQEEQDRVTAQHPDCWISFSGAQPYGVGWRYGENELDPLDHYRVIRVVFRLALDPNIPNHVGWYLKDHEREEVDKLEEAMNAALEAVQKTAAEETIPEETIPEETMPEETVPETTAAE